MAGNAKTQQDRPADTPFKQQRMQAWQPILTPKSVIITFAVLGIVFIPIGIVVITVSNSVVEIIERYDNHCPAPPSDCMMNVSVTADMHPPIYFYYQLTNFYQNHRRYVKSRSDAQLRGVADLSESDLSACEPIVRSPYEPAKIMYPCGLIANSFFTDQFNASVLSGAEPHWEVLGGVNWSREGIAWSTDVQEKFKKPRRPYEDVTRFTTRDGLPAPILLPEVTDEEFMVWMRTAGMPTFKKLNRIIGDKTFLAGSLIEVRINNQFPVSGFNGEKAIVFSTTSVLGGKNPFLGYAYIVVGSIGLFLAAAFLAKHYHSPRTLGDMTYFQWNQSNRRVHVGDGTAASGPTSDTAMKSTNEDKFLP